MRPARSCFPSLLSGVLAVLVLSLPGIAHSAWDPYTELPPELVGYDSRGEIHIHSAKEADALRQKVIDYMWGGAGLPTGKLPTSTTVYSGSGALPGDLAGLNAANIAGADRLQANMDFGYSTAMYLLHPTNTANARRLAIVTHGHCANYDSRFDAGIGTLIDHLLNSGFSVLAMQMPLHGWNKQTSFQRPTGTVTANDHDEIVGKLEGKGGSALRFFIEPVVQGINQFVHINPGSTDSTMIGLSGGGWTTVLAAAIDRRITLSISVAGSMPIYARRFYPGSVGDVEQMLPALYKDRAGYLDLYVLDAYGKGRRHIQLNSQYDSCCFYGVSHTTWVDNVKKAVASTRAGAYDFYLDSTHRQHQISNHAIETLIDPALGIHRANYERPFEPPTRSALIPLPPGAVEPEGWLRDWCLTARDGYTGHMDDVDIAFRQAWASDYKVTGERISLWETGGWPYEGGGYWFEGLAKLGFVLHDKALIEQAKKRLYVVVDNMNPNGISFLWWLNKNKPEDLKAVAGKGLREPEYPMWFNGTMGRSMAAYYAGSGDDRILKTLEQGYGRNPDWVRTGIAMSNPWPAFETYTWTGNKVIKEGLTALFTKGGINNEKWSWNRYRNPPGDKPVPPDHGVMFCETTSPWALGYLWTGKREFLDAPLRWHEKIERECMQPHGVPVFDEYWGHTGAFRGSETCDVAGYMAAQNLLLTITGQARLADRIERAFFNAAPATVARDFKTHVYFQSPNRMADGSLPAAVMFSFMQKRVPLCCTATLNRFLPNYVTNMWMATRDNGLAAVCYGPCKVSALVADRVPVVIECKTDYPFNETIEITVKPQREATFPLSLRIPGWCKYPGLEVNGEYVKASPDANGFVRIERLWKPNDKISLRFRMFAQIATGRDANAGSAPYASVSFGPLLFALPIADVNDANTPDPAAKWQFALDAQDGIVSPDITVERGPMPGKWDWPLASPLKLRARAMSIDWKPTLEKPLPPKAFDGGKSAEWITLVPYGCTKFRVSMLPVTKWTFEKPKTPKESEGWGPERDGLRTRLLPAQKEFFVGRPAKFRLEMKNFGQSQRTYDSQAVDVNGSMRVSGPDGTPVRYVAGSFQTSGSSESIAPGQEVALFEYDSLDLADQYLMVKPGSYTLEFRGTNVKWDSESAIPPSAKITIEMRPGALPPSKQIAARLAEILPHNWDLNLNVTLSEMYKGKFFPPGWESTHSVYVSLETSHDNSSDKGRIRVEIWGTEKKLTWTGKQRAWKGLEDTTKEVESGQAAVYLGKGIDGFIYWKVPDEAKEKWPDMRKKVVAALQITPPEPGPTSPGKANYERPFEPPTRSVLIPLPPGAVEPRGWLRDWCITARDGYTGHMDDVDIAFRQAWASDYKMTGTHLTSWAEGAWPYEGGGYWFEGLAKLGFILHDDALLRQAKSRFDPVVNNLSPNGVLFLWWIDRNKPEELKAAEGRGSADAEWPMWANGLFGRAMAGYYAGSGDPRVLNTLEKVYSSNREWLGLGWSMSNPWPAFETYTWTGNKEIGAALTALFARKSDAKREWSWDRYRRPPSDKPGAEAADHGVHFCECTAPWALGYLWTGKREFLDAPLRWHEKIERECMQPHGVPVFDEFYGPPGAFRGTETCDVAAYMWSNTLLLSISGQARLADRIERAFFNAAPATVSRDFKTHVYMQSPHRMADKSLPAEELYTYATKHPTMCCTAALNRFLPNYVMNMWMATRDNGLAAVCYGPCKVSALVADRVPVKIICKTDYPFNETIEITVNPQRKAKFPLSFRIPGWCKYPGLELNGEYTKASPDAHGFVRVDRLWKPNDKIQLRFRMFPQVATGRDANAGNAPYASISFGPLLFALPIADVKDANTPDPAAKWQFALDAQDGIVSPDITVEHGPMPGKWDWPLESPLKLRARAMSIDWKPTLKEPLPSKPFDGGKPPAWITLVPYGCTKLRVSMLPVTKWTFTTPEPPKESEGWGPEHDGLRTRLLPAQKEYFVGRTAKFRLEMKNFGDSDRTYDSQGVDVNGSIRISGPDGTPVRYVAGSFQTWGSSRSIAPGQTVALFEFESLDVADQYLLVKPGSYTLEFRGSDVKWASESAIPPSAKITIEMRPGTLPISMQVPARLIEILPKGWTISLNMRVAEVQNGKIAPPGWEWGPGTYVLLLPGNSGKEGAVSVPIWVAESALTPRKNTATKAEAKPEPVATYLGKGADGHVYWKVPKEAETLWPDIRKKIIAALKISPPKPDVKASESPKESEGWGPELGGLRTRLLAAQTSYFIGRPAKFRLEMKNFGKKALLFLPGGFMEQLVQITDPDGKPAHYIEPHWQTASSTETIAPGEKVLLLDDVELSERYLFAKPGVYRLQFRGKIGKFYNDFGASDIPPSRTIAIEMRPGTLPDWQQFPARFVEILPKGWDMRIDSGLWEQSGVEVAPFGWKSGPGSYVLLGPHYSNYDPDREIVQVAVWVVENKLAWTGTRQEWNGKGEKITTIQVKPKKGAVYLGKGVDGHVYWTVPKEAEKLWPDIRKKVIAALQIVPPEREAKPPKESDGWGPENNGLRLRLLPDQKQYFIGRTARFRVEIKNFAKEPRPYDNRNLESYDTTQIVDPDGKLLRQVGRMYLTLAMPKPLAPGEKRVLYDGLCLDDQYLFVKPGAYTLQMRVIGDLPPSNKLAIEMQPERPPLSTQVLAQLVDSFPEEWQLSKDADFSALEMCKIAPPGWESGAGVRVPLELGRNGQGPPESIVIWVAKKKLAWTGTQEVREEKDITMIKVKPDEGAVYLGKGADGHVYWIAPKEANTFWPDIEKKIIAALKIVPPEAGAGESK